MDFNIVFWGEGELLLETRHENVHFFGIFVQNGRFFTARDNKKKIISVQCKFEY